jgi:hypothetical protein
MHAPGFPADTSTSQDEQKKGAAIYRDGEASQPDVRTKGSFAGKIMVG